MRGSTRDGMDYTFTKDVPTEGVSKVGQRYEETIEILNGHYTLGEDNSTCINFYWKAFVVYHRIHVNWVFTVYKGEERRDDVENSKIFVINYWNFHKNCFIIELVEYQVSQNLMDL